MTTPQNINFKNILPPERLGVSKSSLEEFQAATPETPAKSKEYTLIVVTDHVNKRILLGKKHRGFGTGFYNSFGGKVDKTDVSIEAGAARELREETGLVVDPLEMKDCHLGALHFTFDDTDTKMLVHLFQVSKIPPDANIRGCDEITPQWFHDWQDIPLSLMFADDSVWLTQLLQCEPDTMRLDGWFHFAAGGCDTNTIRCYYLDMRPRSVSGEGSLELSVPQPSLPQAKNSMERQLFHELHRHPNALSIKEFKEAVAFCNATRNLFDKRQIDVVIDVAGGHGALAALYLIFTSAQQAIVVDPARVGGVAQAWASFLKPHHVLRYRYECLRAGLPAELQRALRSFQAERILVVACHACQHLSEEVLEIGTQFGVQVAVMPCCQRDNDGGSWKALSTRLGVPFAVVSDLLLAGKTMNDRYETRMKTIDPAISPQNRIICLRRRTKAYAVREARAAAHEKLQRAYQSAHQESVRFTTSWTWSHVAWGATGVALGWLASQALNTSSAGTRGTATRS